MSEAVVRLLESGEGGAYRAIRLEALTVDSASFAASLEIEAGKPAAWFEERIGGVFGAFVGDDLVGIAGYSRHANPRQSHKATLYGMYLRAEQRGAGIAGKLVAAVIGHARADGAEMLLLACNANNKPAIRLYELAGFRQYGLEPRALKHEDGGYTDDALYALDLGA